MYQTREYMPFRFRLKDATRADASDPAASDAGTAPWSPTKSGQVFNRDTQVGVFEFTKQVLDTNGRRGRKILNVQDAGDQTVRRIVTSSNGAKVNLDGIAAADVVYGTMTALIRCYGSPYQADDFYRSLQALSGVQGSLLAVVYGKAGSNPYYFSVLCYPTVGRPTRREESPFATGYTMAIDVPVTFERLGNWSAGWTSSGIVSDGTVDPT